MHVKILLYFVLYSFMGWCLESVYKTILEKKPINSGFLYGPFCPIYGFGAIIMILLFQNLSNHIILVFLISMVTLTVWEYIVGVILEKIFKTKYWDYSDLKFNINGRICLKNSIYWGILGVFFTTILHPYIQSIIELIPNRTLFYANMIIYVILITDVIVTVSKMLFIDQKIQQLYEIGEMIKEKITELKENESLEKVYKENIQKMIIELKEKQEKVKIETYRLIIRLKKAFPTMQSETINKFLNPKMEIQSLREKIKKIKNNKEK